MWVIITVIKGYNLLTGLFRGVGNTLEKAQWPESTQGGWSTIHGRRGQAAGNKWAIMRISGHFRSYSNAILKKIWYLIVSSNFTENSFVIIWCMRVIQRSTIPINTTFKKKCFKTTKLRDAARIWQAHVHLSLLPKYWSGLEVNYVHR